MLVIASITHSLTSAVGDHGLYAAFGLLALDAVFPAGSELVMLYGGVLAAGALGSGGLVLFGTTISSGVGALVAMAVAGTLGYMVGSLIGWGVGVLGDRALLERHGRALHLGPERMARAEAWFARFGTWAVFLGRITPLVRSFVSIPAGVLGSRLRSYIPATLAGALIWSFAFAGAGYGLGSGYESFDQAFHYADYVVIAIVVVLFVALGLRLWRPRRRAAARALTDGERPSLRG
jgi:membrane protein DedA with SNARE-associated domain